MEISSDHGVLYIHGHNLLTDLHSCTKVAPVKVIIEAEIIGEWGSYNNGFQPFQLNVLKVKVINDG